MSKRDKGIFIPNAICENPELTWTEKALFGKIFKLDRENGCYATNEFLATFLDISEQAVSRAIKHLKLLNLIYQDSFDGRRRVLKISTPSLRQDKPEGTPQIESRLHEEAKPYNYKRIREENKNRIGAKAPKEIYNKNIILEKDINVENLYRGIQNIVNPERTKKEKLDSNSIIEKYTQNIKVQKELKGFIQHYNESFHRLSSKQLTAMLKKLTELSNEDDDKKIAIIQNTIEKGWKSFYPTKANVGKYGQTNTYEDLQRMAKEDDICDEKY